MKLYSVFKLWLKLLVDEANLNTKRNGINLFCQLGKEQSTRGSGSNFGCQKNSVDSHISRNKSFKTVFVLCKIRLIRFIPKFPCNAQTVLFCREKIPQFELLEEKKNTTNDRNN